MPSMKVFVSHSHEDNAFCRALVDGLKRAGVDVWYDEHNLGTGQLMSVIQRELGARPVFIVILTKHAFASRWVKRETQWAYELSDRDPSRILLPVTGGPIERTDFSAENEWLFLHDFKRVEGPGFQPYPPAEAVARTLHALQLPLPGDPPQPTDPKSTESAADLVARGKALQAQGKHAEALPLLQRATHRAPRTFSAWANLGNAYSESGQHEPAVDAYDRALALRPNQPWILNNKGIALTRLQRFPEALATFDRALALDPDDANTWSSKAFALNILCRFDDALAACERALSLALDDVKPLGHKAIALCGLKRYPEAISAAAATLALDPTAKEMWGVKSLAFRALGRPSDAEEASLRAKALST